MQIIIFRNNKANGLSHDEGTLHFLEWGGLSPKAKVSIFSETVDLPL